MSSTPSSAAPPPAGKPQCPDCGAEIHTTTATKCWLCHHDLRPQEGTREPAAGSQELSERRRVPTARGDSLTLVVFGVLAILLSLGLMVEAPGVLVVLLILATPAFIRTVLASKRDRAHGAPLSGIAAVGTFLSSLGMVAMVGLASVAAFYATCFAVCLGGLALDGSAFRGDKSGLLMVASVGAGLVPGAAVAYFLFRRFWPRKG